MTTFDVLPLALLSAARELRPGDTRSVGTLVLTLAADDCLLVFAQRPGPGEQLAARLLGAQLRDLDQLGDVQVALNRHGKALVGRRLHARDRADDLALQGALLPILRLIQLADGA